MRVEFFVPGMPKPGGSKRVFTNKKTGKPIYVDMSKNQDWKNAVSFAAHEAMAGRFFLGPVRFYVNYHMPRPKYHYNKKGLKDDAPKFHSIEPDADKLTRSTQDALKGVAWKDDGQVSVLIAIKDYADEQCGADIVISDELGER